MVFSSAQQPGAGEVRIIRLDRLLDVGQQQRAVCLIAQGLRLDAAEHRGAARFPAVAVRLLADDVFVAALAMGHQRDQVRLRARRHKQRGFLAEHGGGALFQLLDGRVVAEYIVAHFGGGHCGAHRGAGAGDGVAAEVVPDCCVHGISL